MNTRIFFFNENSTQSKIKSLLGNISDEVEKYIKIITDKQYNNKIGYFQFKHEDTYYKIYIMPKIYKVEEKECDTCYEYQKKFINFFKHYYRLVHKYDIDKYSNELNGNISDLSYKSEDSAKKLASDEVNDIDDFIVHNYMDSLRVIESFFTKYKNQILEEQKVQSQSILHQLDTKKNIMELNKSNIHQIKKVSKIYSDLAFITMEVLKNFINTKIENFSSTAKSRELTLKANQIQISLKSKFSKNSSNSFKIKELLLHKTSKKFKKNSEYKILYKALLKLVGKEHYYGGDVYREIQKEDEMISIFFQPEYLYEWIVYDELLKSNEFDDILKNDKDVLPIQYSFVPKIQNNKNGNYDSKPDLIAVNKGENYPVDAKWKILPKNQSKYQIEVDILKLRRDAMIRKVNKGYLIYPKIEDNSKFKLNTEYRYSYDKDFIFELRVINVV